MNNPGDGRFDAAAPDDGGFRRRDLSRQESDDLLGLAEEAGRLGIFEWQVPANTVSLSPKCLSLYGLVGIDGRYESWRACIFREDQIRIDQLIESAFETGKRELNAEFRIIRASDGALRWIEARNIIFYDGRQRPLRVVGVNVDVTEQKRAMVQLRAFTETLEERVKERSRELETEYEARQRAEEALRQAQKIEAVGQLTGGIAHDFNNLLTIVVGGLEAIGRQVLTLPPSPAASRIARAREMALQGAHRAVALTSRLLAFSRQQPLAFLQALDANKLRGRDLRNAAPDCSGEAVALETVLAGGLWRSFATDFNQLENAVLNLALNARDAMPNGGRLTIETANCHLDETYGRRFRRAGSSGPICDGRCHGHRLGHGQGDAGKGVRSLLHHKRSRQGYRVGAEPSVWLRPTIRRARENLQRAWARAPPSRFICRAIAVKRILMKPEDGAIGAARTIGVETILVVEDDPALRAYTMESLLLSSGYRVLEAASAAAALDILGNSGSM